MTTADPAELKVFVHLAHDKDVDRWRAARAAGSLIGINDDTPYGYGRAERMGCRVVFSRARPEGAVTRLLRLGVRAIVGFDLLHAWHQRVAMRAADVIWTHTESQFLGVAAVVGPGPVLIGQSVWLFDLWASLSLLRRVCFRRLMRRVNILTTLSTENAAIARAAFPAKRVEFIPFGIPSEERRAPVVRPQSPVRVLALGNDRHRDWATLIAAVRGEPAIEVVIFSGTIDRALVAGVPNVTIGKLTTNAGLAVEMARATVVCVPLSPNHHASGITVVEEAVLMGVPVIVTDVGGLRDYFDDTHVHYVPMGEAAAMRRAILAVASDPAAGATLAQRAQSHLVTTKLDTEGYIARHVALSREALSTDMRVASRQRWTE